MRCRWCDLTVIQVRLGGLGLQWVDVDARITLCASGRGGVRTHEVDPVPNLGDRSAVEAWLDA